MKRFFSKTIIIFAAIFSLITGVPQNGMAQINTDQVMRIGRNALYFEDYLLAMQYFNQVIKAKPYLAEPYFYRAVAKLQLDDYRGAEEDCSLALERNPFIVEAYEVRGISRQTLEKAQLAIDDYNKGLEYDPENKTFLINMAVAYDELKQYSKSDSAYTRLIKLYPKFSNAYLGRAQLYLAQGDTVAAISNIDKSIELNNKDANAYVMRADIHTRFDKNFTSALDDMNDAIKLQPQNVSYFINRAYLKYNLDDYFGAMADYDYALDLDNYNVAAHFNRGLLLAQVHDDDKAIKDFSFVIANEPSNVMALYNRADLYARTGAYEKAVADFDRVIEKVTDMPGLYYARSECKRKIGDIKGGEADYNISRKMYADMLKGRKPVATDNNKTEAYNTPTDNGEHTESGYSQDDVKARFQQLLTIENDHTMRPEYEGKTRGRVQDNNYRIDAEPQYMLSYYQMINSLQSSSNFMREVNMLNEASVLPFELVITNATPALLESQINNHFNSIDYYNSLLSTSEPRGVDYFARAIDYIMVKNYDAAIADLDKALAISPKFMLAYFARANARYHKIEASSQAITPLISDRRAGGNTHGNFMNNTSGAEQMLNANTLRSSYAMVLEDYDKVLELSPMNVFAQFNKGTLYLEMQDFTEALKAFSAAIDIKPDFGPAYYNRGLVYLRLGNRENGIADLSKAGELGIMPSYSVLKRMSRF